MTLTVAACAVPVATSTELYCRALAVYDRVRLAGARFDSPDLGLAVSCHLGRARLVGRLDAFPWAVDAVTAAVAEQMLGGAPVNGSCEDTVDWLASFPARFLALLDRRARQTAPLAGGRRAWDRVSIR